MGRQGGRRRVIVTLLGGMAIVSAGCGTRLSRAEILAENTVRTAGGSGATGAGSPGATAVGPGQGTAAVADQGSGSVGATSGGTSGSGSGPAAAGTAAAVNKKPIVIGLIGYFSGIGASVDIPTRDTYLVWQKAVNARGGINGHPVQVISGDNGGDNSRSVSLARDFVENKGAIILSITSALGDGVVDYAASKSIPVIGVAAGGGDASAKNPMLFKTTPGGADTAWGEAALAKSLGLTKVGVVYCAESAQCQQVNDQFVAEAKAQGLQVTVQLRASVTQPDYTAECLQARNSGTTMILPIMDSIAPVRMAQSCARQNYKPTWQLLSAADSQSKVPELDGSISATAAFPWFLHAGAPGIVEYAQAFQTYEPKRLTDGASQQAGAWVTAKVIEKAAAGVGDVPTSQDVLKGLWAMNGETLGGLAPGGMARTYHQGQPTALTYCVFSAKITNSAWTAPQGVTPLCK